MRIGLDRGCLKYSCALPHFCGSCAPHLLCVVSCCSPGRTLGTQESQLVLGVTAAIEGLDSGERPQCVVVVALFLSSHTEHAGK